VVLFLLLLWGLLPPVVAQGPEGHLVVATDYELFGFSDLRGGGHVTWTLTGAKAAELRSRIIHLFDGYPAIPRGFAFPGVGTNGNNNSVLDATEGVAYTNLLENLLEASGRGTTAHYLQLYPFDLREKSTDEPSGFQRSTSGLAGTNLSATDTVEIRFLFEANITMTDARVPLATRSLVDALYRIFSYRAVQSPTLAASGPYPGSWPFLPENGWHVVPNVVGRQAFWMGNDATGLYNDSQDAAARTSADPAFAAIDPAYIPFDFRFASSARATFNYTGFLDTGDTLRLEYAHYPAYTDWTNLSYSTGPSLTPSDGTWSNETVDLTPLLGQRARLRFHFVSDPSGSAPGFFIRDFAIDAPATYVGQVVETDTHYLIGPLSFAEPTITSGGIHLIRTPGGELLTYGASWDASSPPGDTIHFRTFEVTENPQTLFGIMLVSAYAISRLQESAYDRYREAHPSVYRPVVHRAKWLHRAGKVAMGVLVLFYFVPTALWVVGVRVFVSGAMYWFLALTLALTFGFGTRAYYAQRLEQAPPPVVGEERSVVRRASMPESAAGAAGVVGHCTHCLQEVREGDPTYRCTCGALYHQACATGLMRCSNCRKPIAASVIPPRKQVSLRCDSCGELQTVLDGTDPRAATCPACGGRLRRLDAGKRYLIVASHPGIAFAWMRDLTAGGKPALCLSPSSAERLRLEFGVKNMPIVQISANATGAIDPKKLDPLGLRSILPLTREGKGGAILYDGLDTVISEASLGDVIRFLRKANDMAFVHGVTVIGRIGPGRLTDDEVKRLNAEFDEYLDLSAQL
jgi:hypothetical protein